jgi:hypothetical protein
VESVTRLPFTSLGFTVLDVKSWLNEAGNAGFARRAVAPLGGLIFISAADGLFSSAKVCNDDGLDYRQSRVHTAARPTFAEPRMPQGVPEIG